MKKTEVLTVKAAKKKFRYSLIAFLLALIYLISPFDFIPGVAPFEWIEDIPLLIISVVYSGFTYFRLRSIERRSNL
ncbi:MAG: DUF1232 domain-containing protein [Spirochaetes bacterium]|nr:DUF1232 domain-containing protein [Spirochaetota bacterium]